MSGPVFQRSPSPRNNASRVAIACSSVNEKEQQKEFRVRQARGESGAQSMRIRERVSRCWQSRVQFEEPEPTRGINERNRGTQNKVKSKRVRGGARLRDPSGNAEQRAQSPQKKRKSMRNHTAGIPRVNEVGRYSRQRCGRQNHARCPR